MANLSELTQGALMLMIRDHERVEEAKAELQLRRDAQRNWYATCADPVVACVRKLGTEIDRNKARR